MMRGRILIVAGLMLFLVTVLGIASADEVDTWEGFDQYYLERFGEDHYSLVFDTISPEEAGDLWEKWHREGSADTTTPPITTEEDQEVIRPEPEYPAWEGWPAFTMVKKPNVLPDMASARMRLRR
jgi:hypothetical protein